MPIVLLPGDAERGEQEAARGPDQGSSTPSIVAAVKKRRARHPRRDLAPVRGRRAGDAIAAEFPDLLHPNEAVREVGGGAAADLRDLGFRETAPDAFALEPGFESLFKRPRLTGWGTGRRRRRTRPAPTLAGVGSQCRGVGLSSTEKASFDGLTATADPEGIARWCGRSW
jgi:hypothetical protein